ncbi:MAG: radical SAM family heme chaperone HemW [Acetatifactor sp.]
MSEAIWRQQNTEGKISIYFHIPFCVRKCLYCDFLSAPAGKEMQEAYLNALLTETRERAGECRKYTVDTVFIGGGTPSVVEAEWIEKLLRMVREYYKLSPEAEISIEVNPGTVDSDKLLCYRRAGINRLSIGLQSADDEELKGLGRIHTLAQFQDTYRWAVEAGFHNINIDVMSALPGQSLASFQRTLQLVLQLRPLPQHISAYSLIVEEGTFFAEAEKAGRLLLPDEDCERSMYWEAARILEAAGFEHYEISNYARPGFACRHNCGYWQRHDYLGLGIGAASMVDNKRFSNKTDLQEYINSPTGCRGEIQSLTLKGQMEEFMFLGLRMIEGVSEELFEQTFGSSLRQVYGEVIERNIKDGLLYFYSRELRNGGQEVRLALTRRGIDISNYVMAQFLLD